MGKRWLGAGLGGRYRPGARSAAGDAAAQSSEPCSGSEGLLEDLLEREERDEVGAAAAVLADRYALFIPPLGGFGCER